MAFTVAGLAAELGIDPATLASKQDVVSRYDGYLSQADVRYNEAQQALERAARDQQAIDNQIAQFGVNETRLAELQTANAALTAALEEVKKQGLNINMPNIPVTKVDTPDPVKTLEGKLNTLAANMSAGMRVQTKYYSTFGQPLPTDIDTLIGEANAARMPVEQYAEQKWKFAEESQKKSAAELQRKIDEGVQAGVKKWQDEHPVTSGHPGMTPGAPSKFSKVYKPRTADEQKSFRNMNPRERIANSVARTREALAASE